MPSFHHLFKKSLNRNDWIIIISNAVPVAGVWFLGWSAVEAFIVYALETLILGLLTVLKLLTVTIVKGKDNWYNQGKTTQVSGLFFIFFFVLHYGIFAAVQTAIFSGVAKIGPPGAGPLYFFFHWWEFINADTAWMLGTFVASYLLRDYIPFIASGQYRQVPLMLLMFQPYGRILIQQFTVIAGSMFLLFHFDKVFILIFALVKIGVEVYLNFDRLLQQTMQTLEKKESGQQ